MTYRNRWFHDRWAITTPPPEAVCECSGQGRADTPVDHWVRTLNFDGPAWLIREHLTGYGAWDRSELCNHQHNLRRLFWIWCNDITENGDALLYLMR